MPAPADGWADGSGAGFRLTGAYLAPEYFDRTRHVESPLIGLTTAPHPRRVEQQTISSHHHGRKFDDLNIHHHLQHSPNTPCDDHKITDQGIDNRCRQK